MTAGASGLLVGARHAAVRRRDPAEVVLGGPFVTLLAPRLAERLVGVGEKRGQKPSAEARRPAGRGSVAILFGVHMFESFFGGVG